MKIVYAGQETVHEAILLVMEKWPSCIDMLHEAFGKNGIFAIILYFIRYEDLSHDEQEKNPCLIRIHPITIIHACSCRPARAVTITTTIITIP
ncbi:MAG: hypothetical protein IKX48_08360, partial [Victivallales bacterium]|nr:hypothetical protein [Victivallales bacterium]